VTVIKAAVITGAPASVTGTATLALTLALEGCAGTVTVTTDSGDTVTMDIEVNDDVTKWTQVSIGGVVHKIDAINPTSKTFPGGRGAEQLIVYTPAFGATTGTNQWGSEVTVIDNVVTAISASKGNTAIPANGVVISGHDQAGQWLITNAKLDSDVVFS